MIIDKLKKIPIGVRAAFVYTLASVFSRGLAMITIPIFTRIMTSAQIGTVNIYNSWYNLISVVATLSLTSGGFQSAMKDFPDERDQYQSSVLTLTSLMAVIMAIVYFFAPRFWNTVLDLNTPLMILMLLSFLVVPAQDFWLLRQRYEFKYKSVGLLSIGTALVGTILAIVAVMTLNNIGSPWVVEGRLYATKAAIILVSAVLWMKLMLKGKVYYNEKFWKYSLALSLPLVGNAIAGQLLSVSDKIMIRKMVGESAVGIYGTLFTVSSIFTMVWTAINSSFVPYLFQNFEREKTKVNQISLSLMASYGIIAIVVTFMAPEIVRILATEEYYEAIYIMPPIAAGIFLTSVSNMYSNILIYHKKTKYIMIASISAAVVNIAANYMFIPVFGYMAAAYTTLASHIILAVVQAWSARKVHREITEEKAVYDDHFVLMLGIAIVALTLTGLFFYKTLVLRYVLIVFGGIFGGWIGYKSLNRIKKK